MEPGTKIAVISKSEEGVAHVAPSENISGKTASHPSHPVEKTEEDKQTPKVDITSMTEKPKQSSSTPKHSAIEPQLPPKERERRVSFMALNINQSSFNIFFWKNFN